MGRPAGRPNKLGKRETKLQIKMTQDELDRVYMLAELNGMEGAPYVRMLIVKEAKALGLAK